MIKANYQERPIRFMEIYEHKDWHIKIYSITNKGEFVDGKYIDIAKAHLDNWLAQSKIYELKTYQIATLIIHEGKEGCFAILNWWIDENMLQNYVYLIDKNENIQLYSDNGICTCVWEMAVWWHERNAWVNHVLKKHQQPDFESYLNDQLNINI